MPNKRATQLTANVGLYYCCYRLSLLGWNVMPTARNARGVDIIAYSKDAKRKLAIQVKSLSKRSAVPLGSSIDDLMGDFWIIVNNVTSPNPTAFILTPSDVKRFAGSDEKDDRVSFWIGTTRRNEPERGYDQERFKEKWERIGRGDAPDS